MTRRYKAEVTRQKCRGINAAMGICLLICAFSTAIADSTFKHTKHGDAATGPLRLQDRPRGSCGQCHESHGSFDRLSAAASAPHGLFAPDDNNLCFACHEDVSANLSYPGHLLWSQSGHAVSAAMYWPGPMPPARPSADANKCVNCHDPHGTKDSKGPVDSLLEVRQENLCVVCHDGSRAPDVRTDFLKSYKHPIAAIRHSAGEASDPAKFSAMNGNRHSTCADCHNPHEARQDVIPISAPDASSRILGVSRIAVTNGIAGTTPIYTFKQADDTAFAREYELCFKCHSSWTRQPVAQSNLALLTSPSNPSYHPIQAAGRNRNIDPAAFTSGWSSDSILFCSSCHASDDPRVRGPHGSIYQYILKKPSTTTPMSQTMASNDICFDCHEFGVYGDPTALPTMQRASRFNGPATSGHLFHVAQQRVPCYACHETHGSTRYEALIATGRSPGINSFTQTSSGGTCTPTCHGTRTYALNYAR